MFFSGHPQLARLWELTQASQHVPTQVAGVPVHDNFLLVQLSSIGIDDSQVENRKAGFFFCFVAMWFLVVSIFYNRGAFTCGAVLFYVTALSTMTLVLKDVFEKWNYPLFVTSTHFFCTSLFAFLLLVRRRAVCGEPLPGVTFDLMVKGIIPVAACFSASIGLCNTGLALSNVHFYEMVDSCTPIVSAVITLLLCKPFFPVLFLPLGVVCLGLLCCFTGEIGFSIIAFGFLMSGTVLRSCKAVIQQILMSGDSTTKLAPVELVMFTSCASYLIMAIWSSCSEGTEPYKSIMKFQGISWMLIFKLLVSIVNAMVINFAGIFVIRDLGAVAQQLTGTLKGLLTVLGGIAMRNEMVTFQQIIAYTAVVSGIAWYNYLDHTKRSEAITIKEVKQAIDYGAVKN
eukprot:TRINITY_DN68554_c0_g1_i1.p1 TRINITY_DN68554_c0_g1~~TRINITY_DN68554_c0_g1_i1.p1  ORF type:complete len:399 (-),score=50.09 TRINITY_DN68554_c0_g1_i1:99-1295(-)